MIYLTISPLQISFIITVVLIGIFIISFFLYFFFYKRSIKKHYKEHFYKKVMSIAKSQDYYLINNFLLKESKSDSEVINHILFANKYIYLIVSFYFDGDIGGNQKDKSLILYTRKKQRYYIDNPLIYLNKTIDKLCSITGIDESLLIGIALINDHCQVAIENKSKELYIIQRNKLKRLIKAIESRDVSNINALQLEECVKAISELKKRNSQE